jgi:broad specificity phosphatase PhoE
MVDLRRFEGTADLYFLRHGESRGNRDGVIQGRNHSHLTDIGREQARAAGAWFKGKLIDIILTSSLARAEQTARIIGETAGIAAIERTEELMELDTGMFSGLSFEEARQLHPEAWDSFQRESWEGVADAERIRDLLDRAEALWRRLERMTAQGTRRVLCVTHSGFLQWIIRSTIGGTSWMPLLPASENCGVSHLRIANSRGSSGSAWHYAAWVMINQAVG